MCQNRQYLLHGSFENITLTTNVRNGRWKNYDTLQLHGVRSLLKADSRSADQKISYFRKIERFITVHITPPPQTGSYSKSCESSLRPHITLGQGQPKWNFPSNFRNSNFVYLCTSHITLPDLVINQEVSTSSRHFYN